MRKSVKIWMIVAASLILAGGILFVVVMSMLNWDFTKISTVQYETNTHTLTEDFSGISIRTKTADVILVASEDESCTVECREQEKVRHTVSVKDGELVIEVVDTRKWYEHIQIDFGGSSKLTVSLPAGAYGAISVKSDTGRVELPKDFAFDNIDVAVSTGNVKSTASATGVVKIKTSTGHIDIENVSVGSLDLTVSTGEVHALNVCCAGEVSLKVSTGRAYLTDVTCENVITEGDTGDLFLKNVIASDNFSIERDTGCVSFEDCDASEICVKTDTGDVTGSLLTDKVFLVHTDTGKKDVPDSVTGGRCEITTDTGDIRITIAP